MQKTKASAKVFFLNGTTPLNKKESQNAFLMNLPQASSLPSQSFLSVPGILPTPETHAYWCPQW